MERLAQYADVIEAAVVTKMLKAFKVQVKQIHFDITDTKLDTTDNLLAVAAGKGCFLRGGAVQPHCKRNISSSDAAASCTGWTTFRFIRLKNAPGLARGFSRYKSGVQWYLRIVCRRGYTGDAWVGETTAFAGSRPFSESVPGGSASPLVAREVANGRRLEQKRDQETDFH